MIAVQNRMKEENDEEDGGSARVEYDAVTIHGHVKDVI